MTLNLHEADERPLGGGPWRQLRRGRRPRALLAMEGSGQGRRLPLAGLLRARGPGSTAEPRARAASALAFLVRRALPAPAEAVAPAAGVRARPGCCDPFAPPAFGASTLG